VARWPGWAAVYLSHAPGVGQWRGASLPALRARGRGARGERASGAAPRGAAALGPGPPGGPEPLPRLTEAEGRSGPEGLPRGKKGLSLWRASFPRGRTSSRREEDLVMLRGDPTQTPV